MKNVLAFIVAFTGFGFVANLSAANSVQNPDTNKRTYSQFCAEQYKTAKAAVVANPKTAMAVTAGVMTTTAIATDFAFWLKGKKTPMSAVWNKLSSLRTKKEVAQEAQDTTPVAQAN